MFLGKLDDLEIITYVVSVLIFATLIFVEIFLFIIFK